ncbi:MAG: hypothetical protein DRG82_16025 [Deltaproteobacteria bacterium]|nr:MAG: hypothetical protein DRG82_16025 [Deltaproteobacteria bacterium]
MSIPKTRALPGSWFCEGRTKIGKRRTFVLLFLGKAMRATADNTELALISGIDTEAIIMWTWGIGGGLAAAAGMLYGIDVQIHPGMGWNFLIPLFAAAILGGIGNMYGALVGGMVIGIAETFRLIFNKDGWPTAPRGSWGCLSLSTH